MSKSCIFNPFPSSVAPGQTLTISSQDYFNTLWTLAGIFASAFASLPFCIPPSTRLLNDVFKDKSDLIF